MSRAVALGLSLAVFVSCCFADEPPEQPWPFVVDEVDEVVVLHDGDGAPVVCFWSRVQKLPTLIARENGGRDKFSIWWDRGCERWAIQFRDYPDGCDRLVYAKEWQEAWVKRAPDNKPWWADVQPIGLRQPEKSHWSKEK